jgi:hypothetical protein
VAEDVPRGAGDKRATQPIEASSGEQGSQLLASGATAFIVGSDVFDESGTKVGSASAVYLDDDTGQPEWVTVRTGRFGVKESFVPIRNAEVADDGIHVPLSKERVKDAPRIDTDGHLSPQEEQELYRYYGMSVDDPAGRKLPDLLRSTPGTSDRKYKIEVLEVKQGASSAAGIEGVPRPSQRKAQETPAAVSERSGSEAVDRARVATARAIIAVNNRLGEPTDAETYAIAGVDPASARSPQAGIFRRLVRAARGR